MSSFPRRQSRRLSAQNHVLSVLEMLTELGFSKERIAVEINCDIVPKADYSTTKLNEDDTVEVVSFVGGG